MPVIILLLIGLFWLGYGIKEVLTPRGRVFSQEEMLEMSERFVGKDPKECRKIFKEINNRR